MDARPALKAVGPRRRLGGRPPALVMLVLVAAALAACGGGGGDGGGATAPLAPASSNPTFRPSGASIEPDFVVMTGTTSGSQIQVQVMIGGATTSNDIYAFAFDILLSDPTVVAYVTGSASVPSTGSALTPVESTSVAASQNGARVAVGVTKLGAIPGNGVTTSSATVVKLNFRTLKQGSSRLTFAGPPPSQQNPTGEPAALDSTGAVISEITFDGGHATITQP